MPNVWILGNSFSYSNSNDNTWMTQIAKNLQYTSKNFSLNGTSLDYVYYTFNQIRNDIKSNDILICTFTDTDRRWLFDNPCDAIWKSLDKDLLLHPIVYEHEVRFESRDSRVIDAVNLYLEHINNLSAHDAYLQNFLYNLDYLAQKNHIRIIILPCFENISNVLNDYRSKFSSLHIADKSIMTISKDEFENNEFYLSGIMRYNPDPRLNHLTNTNHNVMFEKILNNIKNNEPISFRTGFAKEFVNQTSLDNQDFSKKELFNVDLKQFYVKYPKTYDDSLNRANADIPR